jgi:hypothetical protein
LDYSRENPGEGQGLTWKTSYWHRACCTTADNKSRQEIWELYFGKQYTNIFFTDDGQLKHSFFRRKYLSDHPSGKEHIGRAAAAR